MPPYHILIVDDQIDIRRMLRAGIETLGPDITVQDMPSAEEALLEIPRKPVDLLISDIRLPGISGLELVVKARRRLPDLKIILITALTDSRTHQRAAELKVNAFFRKPLDMPDFLDTVERTLGVVPTILPPPPTEIEDQTQPTQPLSIRLANLRQDLQAIAVVLLDDQGHVMAQAGVLPDKPQPFTDLIPALLTTLSASAKVSHGLGASLARNFLWFNGNELNVCLTHVGASHALLAVASPTQGQPPSTMQDLLSFASQDLLASLARLGASPAAHDLEPTVLLEPSVPPDSTEEELVETISEEDLTQVEEIFQKPLKKKLVTKDLDNFWESALRQSDPNNVGNASVISYEQAKKLGLAPKEKP